jgi:alkylation response protein AidB-like acyl-CoA dehydrogenase
VDRAVIVRTVYDADHEALRDSVRRFLAEQAVPHRERWDGAGIDAEFWTAVHKYGFLGLSAEDPRFAAVVLEEAMAAGLPAVALMLAGHESFAPLTGRAVSGLLAVVDAGSMRAEQSDDRWVLTGAADSVINGNSAGLLLVVATDGASDMVFAVDPAAAGVHRSPADALLGLDAADVAGLRFDATPGDLIDADLAAGRAGHHLLLAAAAMAGARTALAMTVEYVKQRKAFGRPIAEFENTQHVLAGVGAQVTAVGAFVDNCLAEGASLRPAEAAAAKCCAADVLALAVDAGVQLHGGYGYMWEYPIARAYAAARFFRLHGDAGEHLNSTLANAIGL